MLCACEHVDFSGRLEKRRATSLTQQTSMDLERGQRSTHCPSTGDNQKHGMRQVLTHTDTEFWNTNQLECQANMAAQHSKCKSNQHSTVCLIVSPFQACQAVKLPRLNQAIQPSPRACLDSLPFCPARGNQERLPPITNRTNRSTCQKVRILKLSNT